MKAGAGTDDDDDDDGRHLLTAYYGDRCYEECFE